MKLLGIEARQHAGYHLARYQQVRDFGADLFVLNGIGEDGYWADGRYRVAGSQDITDIVAAARAWHAAETFDGVFTFSESGVVAVAAVAEALGLPGVGVDAARKSRNKLLMRQAHEQAGVPHPRYRLVTSLDEAVATAADFGYPVVLKPTLGAASDFVFRIDDPEEMALRYKITVEGMQHMSPYLREARGLDLGPHGVLVESFLDGHEHLFEALAWDDEVYLGSAVDRVTAEGDTFEDDVHRAPTALSPPELARVHRVITDAAHAQGLRRSVMHAEVRYHRGDPYIVEIAIRPGGGGLDLVALATADYSPIEAVMDVARGVKPRAGHYAPTGVHMMGTCLICDEGQLEYVAIPAEVTDAGQTLMAVATARPGDTIRRPPNGNSVLGFLIVTGTSAQDAQLRLENFADKIEVKLAGQVPTTTKTPWERLGPAHAAQ
ncbi:MAG: ATP-grasp domain-containing protein [Actinomycetota bacterium]|nr:ATP-grasp domain-containing protein [Actinomycetota bacterium]